MGLLLNNIFNFGVYYSQTCDRVKAMCPPPLSLTLCYGVQLIVDAFAYKGVLIQQKVNYTYVNLAPNQFQALIGRINDIAGGRDSALGCDSLPCGFSRYKK